MMKRQMTPVKTATALVFMVLILHLVLLGQSMQAQTVQPPPPRPKGPVNKSSINIQSVSGSPKGIVVAILGQNIHVLSASLDRQDPITGNPLPIVTSVGIANIPHEIGNSIGAVGTVTIPLLVDADPNVVYTLTLWAKSEDEEAMEWGTPQSRIFKGYAPEAVESAPNFKLEFSSDSLNVSVAASEIRTLKAQWQVGDNTVATESTTDTHPAVALKFGALQNSAGPQLPTLILSLEDPKSHKVHESKVTLAVKTDQGLTKKVKQAKTEPTQKQGKASFSWQDLAKSGVGAILTYFAAAL
jgi:hypothetical protein